MANISDDREIQERVEEYKQRGAWEEQKEEVTNTSRAIQTLAESIVQHYEGRVGTAEMSTLLRICQISERATDETKKGRVDQLDIPEDDKDRIKSYIDAGAGIVGGGKSQIEIPDEYEEATYRFLESLVIADSQAELDAAIERFAALNIKGIQAGVLSPILFFLHPDRYPVINHASRAGMDELLDTEVSSRLADYTEEAERFREFRDEYDLGGEEGNLRDVDWFFYTVMDETPEPTTNPTIWIEKTAIHGEFKEPGGGELSLGRAIVSPQQDRSGGDRYHTLREANVGDIVIHFLQDRKEIAGASVVDSELITDYDFPEVVEARWNEAQREQGGYLRFLSDFEEFEDPPHIYDDVLHEPEYRDALESIYAEHSGLAYDKNRDLLQGYYFTRCPYDLADVLADASPELEDFLRVHGYDPDSTSTRSRFSDSLRKDPQMFQVPLTEGAMRDNFERTVMEDVPVDAIEGLIETGFDTETARLWGSGDAGEAVEPGDLLLFGDRRTDEYIAAATVKGSEVLSEPAAREFCDAVGWEFSEQYRFVLILEEVYEIALAGEKFWDLLKYKGFPHDGFNRIHPSRIDDHLLEDYESVERFLEEIAIRRVYPSERETEDIRYFWLNTSDEGWLRDQDERFYSRLTSRGNSRRKAAAFQRARHGDRVIVYEVSPSRRIVGTARVEQGLHERAQGEDMEPEEGVLFVGERAIGGPTWQELRDDPELQDADPIASDNSLMMGELDDDTFHRILELAVHQPKQVLRRRLTPPDFAVTLPDELYFDDREELRRQIEASLNSGKHIIFTGPPGTGKTKLAKDIAGSCASQHPDLITDHRFTTATSAWTTYDTIGGYVPRQADGGDELVFQPRIFLNCFREQSIRNDWLVIDEINRSDIDKAFGQLFSVLSGDSVELPYERNSPVEIISVDAGTGDDELEEIVANSDLFPVTPSWRLLATMNTYDKASLYELSYAFMRRFNFIHVGVPDLRTDDGAVQSGLLRPSAEDSYADRWIESASKLRSPLEDSYRELAVIWKKVNETRTIGPSIVRDMVAYLAASSTTADTDTDDLLTDAVISLVYPQLEGMRPQEQRQLIDSLSEDGIETQDGEIDLALDQRRLRDKAADMFEITFEDDG